METSESALLETLRCALSQEQHILKQAEHQLKEWETQPGFYSALAVRKFVAWHFTRKAAQNVCFPAGYRCTSMK